MSVQRSSSASANLSRSIPLDAKPTGRHPWRAVREYARRHIILRFVLGVIVLMGAFYALYLPESEFDVFGGFLRWNLNKHAHASGWVLDVLGNKITVTPSSDGKDPEVRSPDFAMTIVRGCDALEPSALFLAAVIAFPVAFRAKLVGALLGVLCMELTNVVRLVSLFYVGVHWPEHFRMIHEEVWQTAFIVISVVYWAIWALWATRPPRPPVTNAPV
jgi:exosortase/archaeosortase family protein